MIVSDEEARAAQEVAKTAGKALDVAVGAGSALVNGTVGNIASASIGLLGGDWVQEKRKRNLAAMQAKTAHILDGIARERLGEPSPAVVKPLLEAAANESREELQDLWAGLLASAMVDDGKRVRRDFFDAVAQMETVDALVLDIVGRRPNPQSSIPNENTQKIVTFFEAEQERLSISDDEFEIARDKLVSLRCIMQETYPTALSSFGRALLAACRVS